MSADAGEDEWFIDKTPDTGSPLLVPVGVSSRPDREHKPADAGEERDVERVARAICAVHGRDPNETAPIGLICGPNNEPLPYWAYFEEDARAAITAYTSGSGRDLFREGVEAAAKVADDFRLRRPDTSEFARGVEHAVGRITSAIRALSRK